jgi:hypothetical protein
MFRNTRAALVCLSAILVSGCTDVPGSVTRAYEAPLTFHNYQNPELELQAQARALQNMANDLVRRATLRGAATGAVLGCGAALVTASGLKTCATGALVAGGAGSVVGYHQGKKQVADTVSAQMQDLDQHLAGLHGQTGRIAGDLPAVLAAQDAELARLKSDARAGRIPQATVAARIDEIRKARADIALALDHATADIITARATMAETSSRQSVDLLDQITLTRQLETDLYKARSAISLI